VLTTRQSSPPSGAKPTAKTARCCGRM
jgi:hypothetical protein